MLGPRNAQFDGFVDKVLIGDQRSTFGTGQKDDVRIGILVAKIYQKRRFASRRRPNSSIPDQDVTNFFRGVRSSGFRRSTTDNNRARNGLDQANDAPL